MLELLWDTGVYVGTTLVHNGPILLMGILTASALSAFLEPERLQKALMKRSKASVGASVALGAFTPFCACGTMAVILAMLTTALPWGPIMAFLTSSPLMSPEEFILYAGIVGLNFAVALTAASVIVGLGSGAIAHWLDSHTDILKYQIRFAPQASECCGSEKAEQTPAPSCCSAPRETGPVRTKRQKQLAVLVDTALNLGLRQVLPYFALFAAIGYLINRMVPAELITDWIGTGNAFAVPLLALAGLPLYVNGSASVPLIQTLMAAGASPGALLAFMISGPGTSAGVVAGLMTIMKRRAILLYAGLILSFSVLLGYLYDLILTVV